MRHIRRYAASVEQVHADFTINYMDVVPFNLSSIVCPPSPGAHHPPSPPAPHPSPPPPTCPASPSVIEGHISASRHRQARHPQWGHWCWVVLLQVEPEQPWWWLSVWQSQCQSSHHSQLGGGGGEEEEGGSFLWTAQWSFPCPRPWCQCRGQGSGAICHDPVDDISMMEEERVSKCQRGVRTWGGVTLPRTLRRKRQEEEGQEMELEAMREIPWSMYDDGDNSVSIEVHQPPDDSQVTLPISVDPEKRLHVILVPLTTTRHSSPVALEFVMPFGPQRQKKMWKDRRVVSILPAPLWTMKPRRRTFLEPTKNWQEIPHDADITIKGILVAKQCCQGMKPDKHYGLHLSKFSAKTAIMDQDMLANFRHPPPTVCTIQQWEEVERTGRLQVVILSTMEFMIAGMRHHLAAARISKEAHQKAASMDWWTAAIDLWPKLSSIPWTAAWSRWRTECWWGEILTWPSQPSTIGWRNHCVRCPSRAGSSLPVGWSRPQTWTERNARHNPLGSSHPSE